MTSKTLVVIVRGWTTTGDFLLLGRNGGEISSRARCALESQLQNSIVWVPDLDLSMFCVASPEQLAMTLFVLLKEKIRKTPDLERIVLVGYSSGSLLARRVFCMAHGMSEDGRFGLEAESWAPKISRLVVLAGITRGWEYSSASPAHVRFLSPVLLGISRAVGWAKSLAGGHGGLPFIWQIRRGSPFVVSTRIQYVRLLAKLRNDCTDTPDKLSANGIPSTVFLLGARDEFISPADCTELGPRGEFAYIELPGCKHTDVVQFDSQKESNPIVFERIISAIALNFDDLLSKSWTLQSSDIDDYLDPMDLHEYSVGLSSNSNEVDHAVIVVHGIRDNGFWTKRVAREVKVVGRRAGREVRAPSPSYGFFSMWDFIKPGGRTNATYWFMERYAEVCSRFPNAEISFVGHSNGTYIAANALSLCTAIRFKRIVLAGSVIRRDYAWQDRSGQVSSILNYVGNTDFVVAFLPAVFELIGLRRFDVGGAGAFGFLKSTKKSIENSGVELNEVVFIKGGHGAAIEESFWPEIAEFVIEGVLPNRPHEQRSAVTRTLFSIAPAITLTCATAVIALVFSPLIIAAWLPSHETVQFSASTLEFVAYITASFFFSLLAVRVLREW